MHTKLLDPVATLARLRGTPSTRRRSACAVLCSRCRRGSGRVTATDPLQAQEWWLADIGADRATPPRPRRPDHDRRQRRRSDAPGVRRPAEHDVLQRPERRRPRGVPRHDRRVGRRGAGERRRHRRRLPDGRAPGLRRELRPARHHEQLGDRRASSRRRSHCPGRDQPQLREHDAGPAARRTRSSPPCTTAASSSPRRGTAATRGSPPTYPASWPHVFTVAATDENDHVAPFSTHRPGRRHRRRPASTSSAPCRSRATRAATRQASPARASRRRSSPPRPRGSGRCGRRSTPSQIAERPARERARHRRARLRHRERLGHPRHPGGARRADAGAGSGGAERRRRPGEAGRALPDGAGAADDAGEADDPRRRRDRRDRGPARPLPHLGAGEQGRARRGVGRRPRGRADLGPADACPSTRASPRAGATSAARA